jgi:cytochrome c-type biogenesis protein
VKLSVSFGAALIAGILSFLSPCVLPLVPGYIGYLGGVNQAGQQTKTRTALFFSSVVFVVGFVTVFMMLGASSSLMNGFVARNMGAFQIISGLIIMLLGVHFLGLISVGFLNQDVRFIPSPKGRGIIGAYIVGLAFGFGWTPCVGPVLATILMVSAGAEDTTQGIVLLLAYGIGLGLPFIIVAVFAELFMDKFSYFSRSIKYVKWLLGSLLIFTGLAMMTGTLSNVAYWMLRYVPVFQEIG